MTGIAIINSSPITVSGIEEILNRLNVSVHFATSETKDLLHFLNQHKVSFVICDIPIVKETEKKTVHDHLHKISRLVPNVIVITSSTKISEITSIVRKFNFSIISSCENCEIIESQLDKALRGQETLSPKILTILNSSELTTFDILKDLTLRERDLLLQLLSGRSITEVARLSSLSVQTISGNKINIMKKLGVHNEIQLFSKMA